MRGLLKRHFNKTNFFMEYPKPTRFASGPWHSGLPLHVLFVIYRLLLFLTFAGLMIWSVAMYWLYGLWICYATNWGLIICFLSTFFGLVIVLSKYINQFGLSSNVLIFHRILSSDMTIGYKIYWVIYNMSMSISLSISLLYWSVVYTAANQLSGSFAINFAVHGLNSILSLIDLIVGGLPMRVMHFYQPVIFTVTYVTFNIIYWAAGGKGYYKDRSYIYSTLDWENNPGIAIAVTIGTVFLVTIMHIFVCCLSGVRSRIAKKFANIDQSDLKTGNAL